MIQIQDKNVENQVYFPKSTNIEGDLVLKLHSELTQKDYTFDVVNESKTSNYYKFNVNFKSVENGEYTYFINDTDSGLIRIGNVDEAVSTSTYIDGIEVVQYYPQDVRETNYSKEPLTFKILSYGTINWTTSDSSNTKTIEYKLNDGEWTHITSNTEPSASAIVVTRGNKIQFRGNNATYSDEYADYSTFGGSTAEFEVEGNIMSLIDSTDFATLTTLESEFTFAFLFSDCTGLTSAKNLILPATTLAYNCYMGMFQGCTSLVNAPKLPAIDLTIGCYGSMFQYCESLTTAPVLPATTLANGCYQNMFLGCSSLTSAPVLPATTLAKYCYRQMFYLCTSLATAPALPATTLAIQCYEGMFRGCKSLTTAPELPATTLEYYCYSEMFWNCASLTTAPALPATTLNIMCYDSMFRGCTKLNYIKCLATDISASDCTSSWLKGVASTGKFVKAAGMESWPTGSDGIPNNWTIENNIN